MSKKVESLDKVLEEELKDIYSAENQILSALPKMIKKASSESLRAAFETHLEETEEQIARLNKIAQILDLKLSGKTCKAMKGIIEEGKEVLEKESPNPALIDTLLIAAAQRVEHYEITAYGTARAIAEQLGQTEVAALLQETLDEEDATDERLTEISEEEILAEADGEGSEEEDEEDDDSDRPSVR